MLQGAGGNIAASIGDDGIVIVDDQFAPLADKIRAALRGVTDKPLRFIINTHYHFDHTGGNAPLHRDATIIAHENVRKRLASGSVLGNGGALRIDQPADPAEALPVITFEHDVTVHLNGEDIRALHTPHGHTDGDSVVFFPQSNVVHMGDNFVTYGFPFIDLMGGGSVSGMIDGLEVALKQLPADVKVIPGHGPVSNLDDVRAIHRCVAGNACGGGERRQSRQVARTTEAGQSARALEEPVRPVRVDGPLHRDAVQRSDGRQERRCNQAQLADGDAAGGWRLGVEKDKTVTEGRDAESSAQRAIYLQSPAASRSRSEQLAGLSLHHLLTHQRNRRAAEGQKLVVELTPGLLAAA